MANTNQNIKKSKSLKNSSAKNKNRLKSEKPTKPDPNDTIPMSKQLMLKKSTRKTRHSKGKSVGTNRILPNGKPMPSLVDLEKMFEDSDDDMNEHKSENSKDMQSLTCNVQAANSEIISEVTNHLFSPVTRSKIQAQVKKLLNKSSCNGLDGPPRKKLKFNEEYESSELPTLDINNSIRSLTTYNLPFSDKEQIEPCQKKSMLSDMHIEPKELEQMPDCRNKSDNISDSNKTIEYNLTTQISSNMSKPQPFCPLPSTSTDDKIINKNEEMFIQSLKELKNNLCQEETKEIKISEPDTTEPTNEIPLKLQTAKDQTSSIVIDDEVIEVPSTNVKLDAEDDIQIIDSINQVTSTKTTETIYIRNDCEDDDCIIVESTHATKKKTEESDIIDLEYNFIETDSGFNDTTVNIDDEIIDVDALIAQNQIILDKYKKVDSITGTNFVDVDMSTIERNTIDQRINTTIKDLPDSASNKTLQGITNSINEQRQSNNEQKLNNNSGIRSVNLANNSNSQSSTECEIVNVPCNTDMETYNKPKHVFTMQDLGQFFRNPYNMTSQNPFTAIIEISSNILQTRLTDNDRLNGECAPTSTGRQQSETSLGTQKHTSNSQKNKNKRKAKTTPPETNNSILSQDKGDSHKHDAKASGVLGDCPICMEVLSVNVIGSTICGHVFCMSCLKEAVKTSRRCPTCRKVLKSNGYHKLFL